MGLGSTEGLRGEVRVSIQPRKNSSFLTSHFWQHLFVLARSTRYAGPSGCAVSPGNSIFISSQSESGSCMQKPDTCQS